MIQFRPLLRYTALLVAALTLAYSCHLVFFSMHTSADALLEEVWARALYTRGLSAWPELLFTFAPAFFPDFTGHMLAKLVTTNVMDTIYLATLFQVAVLILSLLVLLRSLRCLNVSTASVVFVLVAWFAMLTVQYPGMWLWYYSTNDNLCSTILSFFALALTLSYIRRPLTTKFVALLLLTAFSVVNGGLFIITFVAPAFAASLIWCAVALCLKAPNLRATLRIQARLLLLLFGAMALQKWVLMPIIVPHSTFGAKLSVGLNNMRPAFDNFFAATAELVHFTNPWVLGMIVLWGLSTVLLGWTFFRHLGALRTFLPEKSRFFNPSTLHINIQSDEASLQVVSYFLLFCAMAVPANLLAPLVSGLFFPGLINYRYFSSLIALPLIALPVILHFYHAKGLSYAWARIALPAVLIALCAAMIVMVPRSTRTVEQVRQITPSTAEAQLAECVDNYAETYDLKYGVSEYWMSYPVGFLSKKQTWVNPVCNNMSPCVALDADLYLHPPGVPDNTDIFAEKGYSFILITNGAQFQFTADIVKKSVPSPDKILPCRDGKSIWLYTTKRAVFNAGLETPFTKYLLVKGIADHAALPASQWFSLNDPLRLPLDTIRLDNRYPKGWGVAGMYEKLPVGKYQLQMKIRATSKKPDHVIATIGAGIVTAPIDPLQKHYEQQSFAKDIQRAPTPVTIDIEFEISRAASKEPWGIWSYYHGEGTVQITDVTLTRLRGTR